MARALSVGATSASFRKTGCSSRRGKLRGMVGQRQRLLAERLERGAVARGVLEPRVLLLGRELAQLADERRDRLVGRLAQRRLRGNEQLVEPVGLLEQRDPGAHRAAAPDLQEQVAEEPLGHLRGAVDQLLHLLVDLGEQRLRRPRRGRGRRSASASKNADAAHQNGRLGVAGLHRLDRRDRPLHLPEGVARLAAAQGLEQPLLVLRPLVGERLGEHRVVHGGGRLRRRRAVRRRGRDGRGRRRSRPSPRARG